MDDTRTTLAARHCERSTLVSCSILKKEVSFLVAKNGWPLDTVFLPSSLHTNFEKLQLCLETAVNRYPSGTVSVLYGACHPRMEAILDRAQALRTLGQNCVSILLGEKLFTEELASGAFFLLEEWAHTWDEVTVPVFGRNPVLIKRIFAAEHSRLLAIRTPCSACFEEEAAHVSRCTSLPLTWLDVSLDNLEGVLREILARRGSR